MNHKLKIAILVIIQTLALFFMIGLKQWTLVTGVPVVLETRPVDPRSLFSGDYIRLNYLISQISEGIGEERGFNPHDTIYVVLKEGAPYWTPVSIHHQMPEIPPGLVAIKGEVLAASGMRWNPETRSPETLPIRDLNVRYGIENYYVPEGEGTRLERPGPDAKLSIRVAVDRFGNAGIQAVLINGQERYVESLF